MEDPVLDRFYTPTTDNGYDITRQRAHVDVSYERKFSVKHSATTSGTVSAATDNLLGSGKSTKFNVSFPQNCLLDWNNSYFILKWKIAKGDGTAVTTGNMAPSPNMIAQMWTNFYCYLNNQESNPLCAINNNFLEVMTARLKAYFTTQELNTMEDFICGPWDDQAYSGSIGRVGQVNANAVADGSFRTGLGYSNANAIDTLYGTVVSTEIPLNQLENDEANTTHAEHNAHLHEVIISDKIARVKRMERWLKRADHLHYSCVPLWLLAGLKMPDGATMRNLRKLSMIFNWGTTADILEKIDGGLADNAKGYVYARSLEFVAVYNSLSDSQSQQLINDRTKDVPDNLCWLDCIPYQVRAQSSRDIILTGISDLYSVMLMKVARGETTGTDYDTHLITYDSAGQFSLFDNLESDVEDVWCRDALAANHNQPLTSLWLSYGGKMYPEQAINAQDDLTQVYEEFRRASYGLTGRCTLTYNDFSTTQPIVWIQPQVLPRKHQSDDLIINVTQLNLDTPVVILLWCMRSLRIMSDGNVIVPPNQEKLSDD
jgi:hypothetical protein